MINQVKLAPPSDAAVSRKIKCVVWDLDNTVWDGILLESEQVYLKKGLIEAIQTLDARGILHSIASRNDPEKAMSQLRVFGIADYFLYPQIGWHSKVASLKEIAKAINIGIDTLAFVDDEPFERAEIACSLPEVLCLDPVEIARLSQMPEMQPVLITEDARLRRQMYRCDIQRRAAEEQYTGAQEDFLATLQMRFHLARAVEADLQRAEELTIRTHQLNTTGHTYSYDELKALSQSDSHLLLIASLEDRFGAYGKIGLALIHTQPQVWTIKLMLMSCRVISRGVGTILLNFIMREAQKTKAILRAELVHNDKNRMMHITYKFAGFKPAGSEGEIQVFETDLRNIQDVPSYVQLTSQL